MMWGAAVRSAQFDIDWVMCDLQKRGVAYVEKRQVISVGWHLPYFSVDLGAIDWEIDFTGNVYTKRLNATPRISANLQHCLLPFQLPASQLSKFKLKLIS